MGKAKPVPQLTEQQRKLAEENLNLIYWFLMKSNHSVDQWYGAAAVGLCKAAAGFDPDRGCKFSTFAYICMKREIYLELRRAYSRHEFDVEIGSLDFEVSENGSRLCELMPGHEDVSETAENSLAIRDALDKLRGDEAKTALLFMAGLSQMEIGERLGVSQAQISRRIKRFKERLEVEIA